LSRGRVAAIIPGRPAAGVTRSAMTEPSSSSASLPPRADASAAATVSPRRMSHWRRLANSPAPYSILSIAILLLIWSGVTEWSNLIPTQFLPSPRGLFGEFLDVSKSGYAGTSLMGNIMASFLRMLAGFLLSALVAIPVGIAMGMSVAVRGLLAPIFNSLRPVPAIGLIPLMVLWFGIGQASKVAVIFLASFLFIVLNTAEGVRSVPEGLIRAGLNLGANRLQLFWRVILPASLPAIFTGLKTGLAVSWAVVVAAELLGAQSGLGYMIEDAATFYRIKVVYIGLILIGMIGLLMTISINALERRIVHWVGKT
jgi:ABC-type nitrate/sulfonate/bicarbonate transport system permease component